MPIYPFVNVIFMILFQRSNKVRNQREYQMKATFEKL